MRDYPTRPHDATCGQVFGDGTSVEIVRKMKGTTRVTCDRKSTCGRDAKHTLKITDDIGLAVCSTHHPEKVGGY
jgi:hypothetical protein